MAINIKRIYEAPERSDGIRILVDRLWPRGISKDKAKVDEWLKDIAPSDGLRKWFGHKPERWGEFQKRYRDELRSPAKQVLIRRLGSMARTLAVTLLFAAKDTIHNNAVVLAAFLGGVA